MSNQEDNFLAHDKYPIEEDFWSPEPSERRHYPRTRSDAEQAIIDKFQNALDGEEQNNPDIIGLAKHETPDEVEDISDLPEIILDKPGTTIAAKIAHVLGRVTRRDH